MPTAAVGNARGMSIRVSRYLFPLKLLLTSIHAIGRPTTMSRIVTIRAMLKELDTAPHIMPVMVGSPSTSETDSHSMTASSRTKTAGIIIRVRNIIRAAENHPFLILGLLDKSSILLKMDMIRPPESVTARPYKTV
jgi:hypothetical protein